MPVIYTAEVQADLIDGVKGEDWEEYGDRIIAKLEELPLGTVLLTEDWDETDIDEETLTPAEQAMLSLSFFGVTDKYYVK